MEILRNHKEFYNRIRMFSQDERQKLQNDLDNMRRSKRNVIADMQPYIFYIRQIAGEYEQINGRVRGCEHIERTQLEKEYLLLLASFADLKQGLQQQILNDMPIY